MDRVVTLVVAARLLILLFSPLRFSEKLDTTAIF